MFQDKTQTAENGPVLIKGCTAVLGHLGTSLRASWEAVVRGAATLGKDRAITCVLQHYGQLLPNSLNSQLSHGRSTSSNVMIIVITVSLLLPAVPLSADTYRWNDRDGKVHYGEVVPPEYAGQPYDTLNEDGIVIDKMKDTADVQALSTEQETAVISPSGVDQERQHQADRLLLVQYQSEEEIAAALEQEITQFGYDTKLINLSFDATSSAIREFIRNAADQQRAGQPIRPEQQKEIARLYRHLSRDKDRLANIAQRKTLVRARFKADLKRYRELKLKAKEPLEQG